jgi:glycosyltransferase involved in cell wall biosynthesis
VIDNIYTPPDITNPRDKTMRLLFVTTVPITLEGFLRPFSSHFRAQGWGVDAMAQGVSGCTECVEAFDCVWEVNWSRNPLNLRNLLVAPRQIREIVAREGYDLVHVHTPVAAFVTRYALRGLRRRGRPKIIYTAHGFHFYRGGPPLQNTLFLTLEKLAGRWTDHLVVINREDQEAAEHYNIVPPNRVHYIPGIGVDTQRYRPEAVSPAEVQRVRGEIGLKPEDKFFLMVARFSPGKRHRDALQAFSQLLHAKAHLVFAGTGPLMSKMQALAEDLGVRQRVHFLGHRRDIPALIRASVAVLLPSEREGLSRSAMESLSLEVPVVGTDIRGIRSLLEGGCGLLVKVGNVEGLAKALAWVMDHPHETQAMGRRGRDRMAAYDLRRILAFHETLYDEVLRESHAFSSSQTSTSRSLRRSTKVKLETLE